MRSNTLAGVGLCAALLLVACSQSRDQQGGARTDTTAAAANKPPPFDKVPVNIAQVHYSRARDYFQSLATDPKASHGGAGDTALYESPIDPATAYATLQKIMSAAGKK